MNYNLNLLLSIKPENFNLINNGKKIFEYRKSIFKEKIDYVFLYVTYPEKKVKAYFKFSRILSGSPSEIWRQTKDYAGVTEKQFFDYFSGHQIAYAIAINELVSLEQPLTLMDFCGRKNSPQNFYYLSYQEINEEIAP